MSEQSIATDQSQASPEDKHPQVSFSEILQELQQTPREHWANLLQIMRSFRQSVTPPDPQLDFCKKKKEAEDEAEILARQHQALCELNKLWIEEGDEQEQTETLEYLLEVLDRDRVSI